jgi:hypothetical protein
LWSWTRSRTNASCFRYRTTASALCSTWWWTLWLVRFCLIWAGNKIKLRLPS